VRIALDTIRELEAFLRREAVVIPRTPALPVAIRDKSDGLVLAEAVAGRADVLVTGDEDLLEIAGKSPIAILTPRGLWKQFTSPQG
jgi:uncharacterized protein